MLQKGTGFRRLDDLPDDFREIMDTISRDLGEFSGLDRIQSTVLDEAQQEKLNQKIEKIQKQLMISEARLTDRTKNADDLRMWLDSLSVIRRTFDAINKQGEVGQNDFILKFARNTNQLKSLETDLIAKLRGAIREQETPEAIRLERTVEMKRREYDARCQVYEQVKGQVEDIDAQLDKVMAENQKLVAESEDADSQLKNFTATDSYMVIQKARKKKIMIEEWKVRKAKLMQQIQSATTACEAFRDAEKATAELNKQVAAQEIEWKKADGQYKEELRMVGAEAAISERNNKSMMSQLEKDLVQQRTRAMQSEKSQTNREVQATKAQADRELAKIRNDKLTKMRDVERLLKRATNVMKPQEFLDTISNFYKADRERLSMNLKNVVDGMRQLVDRHKVTLDSSTQLEIDRIKKVNEFQKEVLRTSKIRINQRMSERQLELKAITDMLVTLEGIVEDVQNECQEAEAVNKEFEKQFNIAVESRDASVAAVRKEIDMAELFITKGTAMVTMLTEAMNRMLDTANKRKASMATEDEKEEDELSENKAAGGQGQSGEQEVHAESPGSQTSPSAEGGTTVAGQINQSEITGAGSNNAEELQGEIGRGSDMIGMGEQSLYQMINSDIGNSTSLADEARMRQTEQGESGSMLQKSLTSQSQLEANMTDDTTQGAVARSGVGSNVGQSSTSAGQEFSTQQDDGGSCQPTETEKIDGALAPSDAGSHGNAQQNQIGGETFEQGQTSGQTSSSFAAGSGPVAEPAGQNGRARNWGARFNSDPRRHAVDPSSVERDQSSMQVNCDAAGSSGLVLNQSEHEQTAVSFASGSPRTQRRSSQPSSTYYADEQHAQFDANIDEIIKSKTRIKVTVRNRNALRDEIRRQREVLPFCERPQPKVPLLTFCNYKFKKPDPVKQIPNREPSFVSSRRSKPRRTARHETDPPPQDTVIYESLDGRQKVDFRTRRVVNNSQSFAQDDEDSAIICRKTINITYDAPQFKPKVTRTRHIDVTPSATPRRPESPRNTDQNLIFVTRF